MRWLGMRIASRAVFRLLAAHVSSGEVRDVLAMLPAELKTLLLDRVAAA